MEQSCVGMGGSSGMPKMDDFFSDDDAQSRQIPAKLLKERNEEIARTCVSRYIPTVHLESDFVGETSSPDTDDITQSLKPLFESYEKTAEGLEEDGFFARDDILILEELDAIENDTEEMIDLSWTKYLEVKRFRPEEIRRIEQVCEATVMKTVGLLEESKSEEFDYRIFQASLQLEVILKKACWLKTQIWMPGPKYPVLKSSPPPPEEDDSVLEQFQDMFGPLNDDTVRGRELLQVFHQYLVETAHQTNEKLMLFLAYEHDFGKDAALKAIENMMKDEIKKLNIPSQYPGLKLVTMKRDPVNKCQHLYNVNPLTNWRHAEWFLMPRFLNPKGLSELIIHNPTLEQLVEYKGSSEIAIIEGYWPSLMDLTFTHPMMWFEGQQSEIYMECDKKTQSKDGNEGCNETQVGDGEKGTKEMQAEGGNEDEKETPKEVGNEDEKIPVEVGVEGEEMPAWDGDEKEMPVEDGDEKVTPEEVGDEGEEIPAEDRNEDEKETTAGVGDEDEKKTTAEVVDEGDEMPAEDGDEDDKETPAEVGDEGKEEKPAGDGDQDEDNVKAAIWETSSQMISESGRRIVTHYYECLAQSNCLHECLRKHINQHLLGIDAKLFFAIFLDKHNYENVTVFPGMTQKAAAKSLPDIFVTSELPGKDVLLLFPAYVKENLAEGDMPALGILKRVWNRVVYTVRINEGTIRGQDLNPLYLKMWKIEDIDRQFLMWGFEGRDDFIQWSMQQWNQDGTKEGLTIRPIQRSALKDSWLFYNFPLHLRENP